MIKKLLVFLRKLIDPLWIPPEEMERERQDMIERIEQDRKRKEEVKL